MVSKKKRQWLEEFEKANVGMNTYVGSVYVKEAGLLLCFTHIQLGFIFGIQNWSAGRWHAIFSAENGKGQRRKNALLSLNSNALRLQLLENFEFLLDPFEGDNESAYFLLKRAAIEYRTSPMVYHFGSRVLK